MAEELSYASFHARNVASYGNRLPVSKLIDERWMDAVLARLRDIEDTMERRKRLEAKPGGAASGSGAQRQFGEQATFGQPA